MVRGTKSVLTVLTMARQTRTTTRPEPTDHRIALKEFTNWSIVCTEALGIDIPREMQIPGGDPGGWLSEPAGAVGIHQEIGSTRSFQELLPCGNPTTTTFASCLWKM